MNYDVINSAILDIIKIVNYYNKNKNYDLDLCEKLVVVLLGYYLVFGPEIFKKINLLLDSLNIYQCDSEEEYQNRVDKINPEAGCGHKFCPITMWDYKYHNNKFIGAEANIIFFKENIINDVFYIVHELSHSLEGVKAEIISEDNEKFVYKHGFSKVEVIKKDNISFCENCGFAELVTTGVENRIMKELLKLDQEKIESKIIKNFLEVMVIYKDKSILVNSYETLHLVYKDLFDNNIFWELIKKYYYENQSELLAVEFNAFSEELNLRVLINCAERLVCSNINDMVYYGAIVKKQVDIFSKVTSFEPDKSILVLV